MPCSGKSSFIADWKSSRDSNFYKKLGLKNISEYEIIDEGKPPVISADKKYIMHLSLLKGIKKKGTLYFNLAERMRKSADNRAELFRNTEKLTVITIKSSSISLATRFIRRQKLPFKFILRAMIYSDVKRLNKMERRLKILLNSGIVAQCYEEWDKSIDILNPEKRWIIHSHRGWQIDSRNSRSRISLNHLNSES